MPDLPPAAANADRPVAGRRWGAGAGVGLGAAVLALLPWLITGMRLPLQNLWATPTAPQDMPVALLPFSQYALTELLSLIIVAYGIAGLAVRRLTPAVPVLAVGAGALAVHGLAAAQATSAVAGGLTARPASTVYLAALLAVVTCAVLTGLLVLRLLTSAARPAAVVGLALLALFTGPWMADLLLSLPGDPASGPLTAANAALRWLPALLVGAAIAWGGLATRAAAAAAALSLLMLWLVPALLTAVTSAVGSRVLLPYPAELLAVTLEVLRAAALSGDVVLPPLLLAVAVAGSGITAGAARRVRT